MHHMKTLLLMSMLSCLALQAKKVKFAVDMTGQTVSPNGVHITGDFQTMSGLGADWDPATAVMTQEGTSNIYSIIVNLPAFRKYEYRFINGIETYESEFIPDESRVGYDMVDNRWLYVDSLRNDTTFPGNIVFAGNAPAGKQLIRYKVDMRVAGGISSNGVHVATSYQSSAFSATEKRMYSFNYGIYEIIDYVAPGTYTFAYVNGNATANSENVTGSCSAAGKRTITLTKDSALTQLCFATCAACIGVGLHENYDADAQIVYPNPAANNINIPNILPNTVVTITDLTGKTVLSCSSKDEVSVASLENGIYMLITERSAGIKSMTKLVVSR
jgi:alpha-amylase